MSCDEDQHPPGSMAPQIVQDFKFANSQVRRHQEELRGAQELVYSLDAVERLRARARVAYHEKQFCVFSELKRKAIEELRGLVARHSGESPQALKDTSKPKNCPQCGKQVEVITMHQTNPTMSNPRPRPITIGFSIGCCGQAALQCVGDQPEDVIGRWNRGETYQL